jgi:hypothetical protein
VPTRSKIGSYAVFAALLSHTGQLFSLAARNIPGVEARQRLVHVVAHAARHPSALAENIERCTFLDSQAQPCNSFPALRIGGDGMAILSVGPRQQFTTIAAAVAAASPGDTINVQAGTYTNDFVFIGKSLTLQAVGGEVKMVATMQPPNQKAMIVEGVPGVSTTINGFDISGVTVGDENGAAIRYEGGNLSLSNDYFHNNQEGLLGAADPNGNITIDHSEFAFNGFPTGFAHNLYVGNINSLTVTNSCFHDAIEGHEIKSRANNNTITGNRIFDNNGTASYSVDLPNGGNANISNNVIEQGANSDNRYIIAYGEETSLHAGTSFWSEATSSSTTCQMRSMCSIGPQSRWHFRTIKSGD